MWYATELCHLVLVPCWSNTKSNSQCLLSLVYQLYNLYTLSWRWLMCSHPHDWRQWGDVNAEFHVSHDSDHSCHIHFFISIEYKLRKPHTVCTCWEGQTNLISARNNSMLLNPHRLCVWYRVHLPISRHNTNGIIKKLCKNQKPLYKKKSTPAGRCTQVINKDYIMYYIYIHTHRLIRKSLRNFRTWLRNNQDTQQKGHIKHL
jgi:hypothetical protein